jgi:photosystem II stability/assembly factor-like uncharacterized protein
MPAARRALVPLLAVLLLAIGCHETQFEPKDTPGIINIYDDLFSVNAVNDDLVLAAGYWGAIYRSSDGGKTWWKAQTDTKKLVYGISMADELHGWAVGQLGLVLRTDDGGKTWTLQHTPKDQQGVHLFAVQALSDQRAIAVGEWGTIIDTADGGKSWEDHSLTVDESSPQFVWLSPSDQQKVRSGQKVFEDVGLNDVSCLRNNTQHCWIIGEFAYLFRSDDGGQTWERGKIDSGIELPPIEFGYNQIDLSDQQVSEIQRFAKSIVNQSFLNVAIAPKVSEREIKTLVKPDDPSPLFELIEARTQAVEAAVEDAGISIDRVRKRNAPPWDYEDYLKDDPNFLKRYLQNVTSDKPSVAVDVAQNPYLFSVRFSDENDGFISGLGGIVLQSTDGGRTWHYHDMERKVALFSLHPFDPSRVIVVGEKGVYKETDDGGTTWQTPGGLPPVFTFMRDIDFAPDQQVGYIVGERGLVLRTSNGGKSWTEVLPPASARLASAAASGS